VTDPSELLVVYGSLAPGRSNHHVIAGVRGTWSDAFVRGHLHSSGWGITLGYLGLVPDPDGERLPVKLFSSPELPGQWARLDEFEGPEYRRVLIDVEDENGVFATAYVYAVSKSSK
jgi:gamma-glutamylcyclotransferase (GGCT)/AIG2-like uncharacterized protein YtfP